MRLRIADRVLVFIAGILLLACVAGIVAQMFFGVDLIGIASRIFTSDSLNVRIALIGLTVLLFALGVYCVFVLFRHRKRKDKFILQKNDNGELVISIKALENMVQKCLDQHNEIDVQHLYLENKKDGLLIRIRGDVAGGISIPLTVEALQKQIRQYVTACSGVEIKGIRVQIDSSGKDAENAPFAIASPAAQPLLHESEEKQNTVSSAETSPAAPEMTATPVQSPDTEVPADEEDDRPLHQRLFSTKPEPCIVPEPPADDLPSDVDQPAPAEENAAVNDKEELASDADTAETDLPETEPAMTSEPEDTEEKKADDFIDSLKAFDDMVTGEKTEEKADE